MKGKTIYQDEAINAIRRRKREKVAPAVLTRQEAYMAGLDAAINAVASVPDAERKR